MKLQTMTVRAKPGVLVPVPKLLGNVAKYVDRELDFAALKAGELDLDKLYPIKGGTKISRAPVDTFNEMFRAIKHGDLLPGDEATAAFTGVPFTSAVTSIEKVK